MARGDGAQAVDVQDADLGTFGADDAGGLQRAHAREAFFHLPLVIGVGKLRIAAEGIGLDERDGVVGVVAVGRAAAGDDELPYARAQAGVQDIFRAQHIHRVNEFARHLRRGRHD